MATGAGQTPDGALKSAVDSAVEQAVGVLVGAMTIVAHDKVIEEKIITASNAFVEKYDVLKKGTQAGQKLGLVRLMTDLGPPGNAKTTVFGVDPEAIQAFPVRTTSSSCAVIRVHLLTAKGTEIASNDTPYMYSSPGGPVMTVGERFKGRPAITVVPGAIRRMFANQFLAQRITRYGLGMV